MPAWNRFWNKNFRSKSGWDKYVDRYYARQQQMQDTNNTPNSNYEVPDALSIAGIIAGTPYNEDIERAKVWDTYNNWKEHNEIIGPHYDPDGNYHNDAYANPSAGYLSNADPIGEFFVLNEVLGPLAKFIGRGAQQLMARAGNQLARNQVMGRAFNDAADASFGFNNRFVTTPASSFGYEIKPNIRTKIGDVEIDNPEVTHFYHGSPVKFDMFNADFIGSGEGGSKVMRGINLWPEEKIGNAPKFANIRSLDAPLHLGVPSKPLGGELNPTVYDVSGKGLKLYKATPKEIKSLSQEDLIKQGYDGVQASNQVTIFPESISKLSIDKQSSIEDFIMNHPEVERWNPWTTDRQKMQNIIDRSKMSKWTPEQWTAAQDAAIARGDMTEAQRLRDLHFKIYQNGDMVDINGNPIHVYHGSPEENITEFYKPSDSRLPTPKGINYKATGEEGIYTSPRKGYAANYIADLGGRYRIPLTKEQKALLKAGKTREEIGLPSIPRGRLYDLYSNTKLVPEDLDIEFNPFTLSTEEAKLIKSKGYSGFDIPGKKYPEHVVLEPNQLKLADAVTYDDNGIRIPLGKRDNFNINDIRYGLAPLGFGIPYLMNNNNNQ